MENMRPKNHAGVDYIGSKGGKIVELKLTPEEKLILIIL